MSDYLAIANLALERWQNQAESDPAAVAKSEPQPAAAPKKEAEAELNQARAVLDGAGVRLMEIDGVPTAGIWSDLDTPEVRAALRSLGWGTQPIRYLDGAGVPMQYKVRHVVGEPVPMSVLVAMEQSERPWEVRDQMLAAMRWRPRGVPYCEWSADQLGELFRAMSRLGARR
jgi:hypothetical protein